VQTSTAALLTDAMLAFEIAHAADIIPSSPTSPAASPPAHHAATPASFGLEWPELPRTPALFADAAHAGHALRECAPLSPSIDAIDAGGASGVGGACGPSHRTSSDQYPEQWTRDGARPMAAEWQARFCHASADFADALAELRASGRSAESVLGHLHARIGHEAGGLLRTMHRAGISWGTYVDAMCFDGQWHCNAHTNNLVVLSEEQAALVSPCVSPIERPLLACLDTDMAFSARTFVDMERRKVGAPAALFATLLARERINFAEVLAGGDSSTGVPSVAMSALEAQPAAVQAARHALHDTLVRHFLLVYDEGASACSAPMDELMRRAVYATLRMAIIVMADCLA